MAVIGGLFFAIRDHGSAVHGFAIAAGVIAAITIAVGIAALRLPRSLPLFAPAAA